MLSKRKLKHRNINKWNDLFSITKDFRPLGTISFYYNKELGQHVCKIR